jgi:peroxiredoxin
MNMNRSCVAAGALLTVFGVATTASAATAPAVAQVVMPTTADNFRLSDQNLHSHELRTMSDAKAVVLITEQNNCPISRNMATAVKNLQEAYAKQGVEFFMLNSTPLDKREEVIAEAKSYGYNMPVLLDTNQLVGEQLGVTRTAEAIVIDTKTWKIVYRGPVDDHVTYERQKAAPDHTWAKDALDSVIAGRPVAVAQVEPVGCIIDFPQRAKVAAQPISYAKAIAPMMQDKCVSCHQPGGIAPMPFTSFEQIAPFAPMIREMIRTQRMPPWRADPSVGHFLGDRSLTAAQIKTLVHWVEQGAPRGDGVDPLLKQTFVAQEWPLGKPDLVLEVPAYNIPANGIVDYQRPYVLNPLKEGKWLRASTIKVENRSTVHHVLTGYLSTPPGPGESANESTWGASVGGYAVGAESYEEPKDTGVYLPPGGAVGFQLHYTPNGKAVTEHTKIALYFYKDTPKLVMRNSVVANPNISIPPNVESWEQQAYITFPKEALLYGAFPHAHYRGDSSQFFLITPDGNKTLLLALPHYDFNWQREYSFVEPVKVPAGSKLLAVYTYNNSERNAANPDHNRKVPWGDQSFDEMLYTAFHYRWVGETSAKMADYNVFDNELNATRLFGILDTKMNGKLDESELVDPVGEPFKASFAKIDADHDGFIEPNELAAAQAAGARRRQQANQQAPAPAQAQTAEKTGGQ